MLDEEKMLAEFSEPYICMCTCERRQGQTSETKCSRFVPHKSDGMLALLALLGMKNKRVKQRSDTTIVKIRWRKQSREHNIVKRKTRVAIWYLETTE